MVSEGSSLNKTERFHDNDMLHFYVIRDNNFKRNMGKLLSFGHFCETTAVRTVL